jgi:hypothetical protein
MNYPVFAQHSGGALLRTGQGAYADADQKLFMEHYDNFVRLKILRALWHFHQPEEKATAQVAKFVEILKSLPCQPKRNFIDVEDISYNILNPDGSVLKHIGIFPPSKEFHTLAMMEWCETYERETGKVLGFYTRAGYWNDWVIRSNTEFWYGGVKYKTPDWSRHPLWIASWYNYVWGDPRLPLDWQTWTIHQYQGGDGRTEGVLDYWGNLGPVDQNRFNGTHEQMLAYFDGEEVQETSTMAQIHVKSTPMAERAWGMEWKTDQAIPAGITSLGLDWVTLPMVTSTWDGSHQRILPAATFAGRFALANAAGLPVIGKVDVDAAWVSKEMHTKPELEQHDAYQNRVIRPLMANWVNEAMDWEQNPDACWEKVKAGQVTFRQVAAIMLSQTTTTGLRDEPLAEMWQAYFLGYVVKHLKFLMEVGKIPTVPVIYQTSTEWLAKYPNEVPIGLAGWKNWLWLALTQPTLFSTATFADLWSIYKFAPSDAFKFDVLPDGYQDRVLLYEFTHDYQYVASINGSPVRLALWCDTATKLKETLKAPAVVTPPVKPPVVIPPADTVTIPRLEYEALKLKAETLAKIEALIEA